MNETEKKRKKIVFAQRSVTSAVQQFRESRNPGHTQDERVMSDVNITNKRPNKRDYWDAEEQ